MSSGDKSRLTRFLRPRSIVYVGGAQIAGPIRASRRAGYSGDIWVVNPTADSIEGIGCIRTISDLPFAPDAAVVGLSPDRSVEAVRALAQIGAGGAVVMSGGFKELNPDGAARQAALQAAAGDMPVLGPNCMGLINHFSGAAVWGDDNLIERLDGPGAAILSQSGAMVIGITNVEQAFPLGYSISLGNQAVTDMADLIHAFLEDDRIRAIGLYLEGMDNGAKLGSACAEALRRGVPVIALKGGDQPAGAQVALSHTASMVVERDMWDAFCERFGIAEVSSPKALVETLKLLTVGGLARGNRVSILSYSGGINGLAATRAAPLGLSLPMPTDENYTYLRDLLPESVVIANPLDFNIPYKSKHGISMEDIPVVGQAIAAFARDVADQVAFLIDVPRPGADGLDKIWCDALVSMIDVARELGVPCTVAGILPEGLHLDFRKHLTANGVPALLGFSETMEALSVNARLAANRSRLLHTTSATDLLPPRPSAHPVMLDEAQSKNVLAQHGLTLPRFEAVDIAEAGAAAGRLGFPVAIKVLSDKIAHKARLGGVQLGISTADDALAAAYRIARDVGSAEGGHSVNKVLVERMVDDAISEMIIGVKRHPSLGLAMIIGRGGSHVEEEKHFETLLLPLREEDLERALARLGQGRNAALAEAARAVARYAESDERHLITLDVNPVMLTRDGRAVAADALIFRTPQTED